MNVAFGPDDWPEPDLDRYLALENVFGRPNTAVSSKGMIAGTSGPFAVHAGLEVLKHGGSAADAALTTVLTQVALFAGATISYADITRRTLTPARPGNAGSMPQSRRARAARVRSDA
jgi:gamma-glutamyltranspeptidase/glutathione hydrolase